MRLALLCWKISGQSQAHVGVLHNEQNWHDRLESLLLRIQHQRFLLYWLNAITRRIRREVFIPESFCILELAAEVKELPGKLVDCGNIEEPAKTTFKGRGKNGLPLPISAWLRSWRSSHTQRPHTRNWFGFLHSKKLTLPRHEIAWKPVRYVLLKLSKRRKCQVLTRMTHWSFS